MAVADDEAGVRSAAIEGISCAYCAFGVSGGVGAAPVGAAFFFFFFGACSAGCWASACDAVRNVAGTAKLAANPARRNNFRRVTSLMANPWTYGDNAG
jgi:hypothetical protein